MVVIYECFPSDNELINKVRQSYRASLHVEIEEESVKSGQSSPDDSCSLKTILSETEAIGGKSNAFTIVIAHLTNCI